MEISELQKKVKEFDEHAGFDTTTFSQLIDLLKEEITILEKNEKDKNIVNHQLTDILILIMQIAYKYNTNFDQELTNWFEKSKKYLSKELKKEVKEANEQLHKGECVSLDDLKKKYSLK